MRIAMFGHKQIPSRQGGVEVVVENLAVRLAAKGNTVVVYNRNNPRFRKIKKYKAVNIKTVPTLNKRGLAAISASFFASLFVSFRKFDVIHIHAEGPAMFCWLPKLFGKKVVVTVHGLNWQSGKWKNNLGSKAIKFGERMAVKYADEIIVLNEKTKKYFLREYSRKVVYIPNGVNRPRVIKANIINKRWGLEKDNYILFLSRIVDGKGVDKLIQAFKQLSTTKRLVIAGGPSDSQEYFNKVRHMAKDDSRILFTGPVQDPVLSELYSNSYIYVLPSNSEGMPLTLLEAMSYGNCVLVSDIPECSVVVDRYGKTFKTDDVNDLKEKLKFLLNEPQIVKNYRNKSADFILKKYDWNKTVLQTMELYK